MGMQEEVLRGVGVKCYHCGQSCDEELFQFDDKNFCCYGCKTVFEILSENDLCAYYNFETSPGLQQANLESKAYSYLDEVTIRNKIIEFEIENSARVSFQIPAIHCVSCIWLLENLNRLNKGIIKSEANFVKKVVSIDFNPSEVKLSQIAELLASTGYEPTIRLDAEREKPTKASATDLLLKLSVAGFCFGNIMLLSFPEYLGIDAGDDWLRWLFSYLNIALSVPVLLYSGRDYLIAAFKAFQQRQINIDVPIAVGLIVLFVRSVIDIYLEVGPGYLDSLSGLVFFLLIGRWFQSKTYESLAFDRDYKSYFPLAVYKKLGEEWVPTVVYELRRGDQIRVRNNEIIPADSYLLDAEASIDYSFVTGESKPVKVLAGERIFAGGRMVGKAAMMTVDKETSQSHLTSLWNNNAFTKSKGVDYNTLMNKVAKIFTWSVLFLALATAVAWYFLDASRTWLVVTSVLMVACPCALALAAPFTYGNVLRVFGNHGLYLKNAEVVEQMARVDAIVFDKTGTITKGTSGVAWNGVLTLAEKVKVKALASSSTHPLSTLIAKHIKTPVQVRIADYCEYPGRGIEAMIEGQYVKLGSAAFVGAKALEITSDSHVYVSFDNEVRGNYTISTALRNDIQQLISHLGTKVKALLSGDSDADKIRMKSIFEGDVELRFDQSPHDKLSYISTLQEHDNHVMMLGDGLNDSGALKQSDVGIAITDDTGLFTPACDGILDGNKLGALSNFLSLSHSALTILKISLGISLVYNVVGLSFAVTGHLTPLVAAILMPISSISVVGFTTLAVNMVSKRELS